MALTCWKAHIPIQVSAALPYEAVLEATCSALPLIFPVLELYNTQLADPRGYDVEVEIEWQLDLGTSPDPINTGLWSKVVATRLIPPRQLFVHHFDLSLCNWQQIPAVKHILTITTESVDTVLVHGILSGVYDQQMMG
jgi:hypothetical protein